MKVLQLLILLSLFSSPSTVRDLFVDSWTEDSQRPCRYVLSSILP